jgi:3-deoxy-D-manno-octulosonic-acid transferase
MSKKPYTISDLIADLSKQDPDAPVLVAYWTPDLFDLTNEQFQQALDASEIEEVDCSDASEDLWDAIRQWKSEQGLEDSNE